MFLMGCTSLFACRVAGRYVENVLARTLTLKCIKTPFDGLDPVVEYSRWNGRRDEFYRGAGAQLLTLRHFPVGTAGDWYHLDGRGSVSGLTKQQGQSTHNYRYAAYGQLLPTHGNWTASHPSTLLRASNHYTFSGKEWDVHLNLYEFGYRQYPSPGSRPARRRASSS